MRFTRAKFAAAITQNHVWNCKLPAFMQADSQTGIEPFETACLHTYQSVLYLYTYLCHVHVYGARYIVHMQPHICACTLYQSIIAQSNATSVYTCLNVQTHHRFVVRAVWLSGIWHLMVNTCTYYNNVWVLFMWNLLHSQSTTCNNIVYFQFPGGKCVFCIENYGLLTHADV